MDKAHEDLVARLKNSGMPSSTAQAAEFPTEPYKGLSYFNVADGPIFGQRDEQIGACLSLLNNSRVLILHGQSGAGKSSFLRAGLLRELLCNQAFLTLARIEMPGEGYVVRATGDPAYRLRKAIAVALEQDTTLRYWLTPSVAESLRKRIDVEPLEVLLKEICVRLPRPLIIAIDQAEEVLTLVDQTITRPVYNGSSGLPYSHGNSNGQLFDRADRLSGEQSGDPKARFFEFLERVCRIDIRLKFIIALRTEYYGQFCDNFRIPPNNSLSTVKSGVESYWLSGLHTQSELMKAIMLPQEVFCKAALDGKKVRSFEIDPALPRRLVGDLTTTKGAASALPILQLVCKELYAVACVRAQTEGGVIKLKATDLSKGVAAVVDEYIDQKVRQLEKVGASRVNTQPERWRRVLASLVGRQEGGVLITLLTPLAEISKRCSNAGLEALGEDGYRPYLDGLCASGLLRSVNYGQDKEPEYSLGHDALAPYLYRWHLQQATVHQADEKYRRIAVVFGVPILAVMLGAALAFYSLWFLPERQKLELAKAQEREQFVSRVKNALDRASSSELQDAGSRISPALFALGQFQG